MYHSLQTPISHNRDESALSEVNMENHIESMMRPEGGNYQIAEPTSHQ